MADPMRNDSGDPVFSAKDIPAEPILDDHSVDELLAGFPAERTLPQPSNPRLNRTAESIGAALGTGVGKMRNGLSLVQSRQREATRTFAEKVSQQAESLTSNVREQAGQLGDLVQDKTEQLAETAQQRWSRLRVDTRDRVIELRNRAAVLRQDRPLQLVGAFAASAFVIGIALRIWRSNGD